MIIMWIFAVLFVGIAIPLLRGKGAFLISGYNMKNPKEKALYNEMALCQFTGKLLLFLAANFAVMAVGFEYDIQILGFAGTILVVFGGLGAAMYVNTGRRFLKEGITDEELRMAAKGNKWSNVIIIAVSAMTVVIVAWVFIAGEIEPTVTVREDSLHISGMYGTTVPFVRISEIELVEDSMVNIGAGRRRNGYGGFGTTLKGQFDAGLIFVDSHQSPTLRIERTSGSRPNIYISFRNPDATRALYHELRQQF